MSVRSLALLVASVFLAALVAVLEDYGPTWDHVQGDFPYGERLLGFLEDGDARYLDLQLREPRPEVREPHLDLDARRFESHMVYPPGALLSAVCCRLVWTDLGWLDSMRAHLLGAVLPAVALVALVTAFGARQLGTLAGLVAGASLALGPAFFGQATSNVKDVPEAFLYTAAVLLGWRALESGRARAWLPAGALVGLALAQKPNAVFLPVQLALFLALTRLVEGRRAPRPRPAGLGWATLGFAVAWFAASPAFWVAPIEGPLAWVDWMMQCGNHAFLTGQEGRVGEVSFHGPLALLRTTAVPTLALAALGLFARGPSPRLRLFLVVGAGLPVARTLLPGMRDYDGVRHFLEALPMLCLLAGAGARRLAELARSSRLASVAVAGTALASPVVGLIATHPHQALYFNAIAGGLGGAQRAGDRDAVDSWAITYWQGLRWLAQTAEPGAAVLVPRGEFVARAAWPLVARPDLRLCPGRAELVAPYPLYVLVLANGPAGPAVRRLEDRPPVHVVAMQGGELLRIHRLDARDRWYEEAWLPERGARAALRQIVAYLRNHRELRPAVMGLRGLPAEVVRAEARDLFPPELHDALEDAVALDLLSSADAGEIPAADPGPADIPHREERP